ncbi:energy transducer TonB [Sphingomicrobium clamense]|uniref:Energy transducer TonB n=1 Tax=Sphingomicrobium clamense TaxID=2851013 RepID=A0ABS6V9J3_9SPHN|nr:TonB family protein [Sphingomicrobium sp. B8]MBW0145822.1 energy transducer TonB [Sphingomicrobium sp. B8]
MIALLTFLAATASPPPVDRTMDLPMERPESASALGHFGTVTVHARIGANGELDDLVIASPSGSDLLDADAIAMLSNKTIRGSAEGNLVAIAIGYLPFNPDNIPSYTCRQAGLALGWWQSLSSENEATNSSIYHMLSGLLLLATMDKGSSADVAARYKAFRANFGTALERCADRPDDSFLATAVKSD